MTLRSAVVAKAKQLGGPAMTIKARFVTRGYDLPRWGNLRRTTPYPFRAPQADYTEETVAIASSLGFTSGFTTRSDFARTTEPPLERSRFACCQP
jgi:hypothetical protein